MIKIKVQHKFDLNFDVLVETFRDNPERVCLLVPLIEKLSNHLIEKGYEVKMYENGCIIPESLVIVQHDNIADFAKTKGDLVSSCNLFGINRLFE